MTIITDFDEAMKLERSRRQPSLEFVPFSMPTLLGGIKSSLFPDVMQSVNVYFVTRGSLACRSTRNSPPPRAMAIRCSRPTWKRRWPASRRRRAKPRHRKQEISDETLWI